MPPSKRLLSVKEALEALLPDFQRIAGPVASRLGDPTIGAEDLVSIANTAVLETFPKEKHKSAADPTGYLFGIGQNAMRDAVRDSERRRRIRIPLPEETVVESAEDSAVRNLYTEELLDSLPEDLRDIVERRYLQQQTIKEIAANLNVSTRTIDRWLLEALKQLRTHFADSDET